LSTALEGLLLIDKPSGPTSHDIVATVRRLTAQRRVGHTGTLDPPASGLLVLALGRATRLIRFLPHAPKLYEGTIVLGLRTTTDDLSGEVVERSTRAPADFETVALTAKRLLGRQMQAPPAFSARKVEGRRAYRLARSGVPVQPPSSPIEVTRFELQPAVEADCVSFVAEVSAGTYIRGLARDLGQLLGCGATLATLRRTAIGPWHVGDALAAPSADASEWTPTETIPLDLVPLTPPRHALDGNATVRFVHGGKIPAGGCADGWVHVTGEDGRLLGVGEILAGELNPRVVLRVPEQG
jgi:tRNA pseudouridine55 synthase